MVKFVLRKLGQHKAWGQAHIDKKIIELDPNQSPLDFLDTAVHELLHIAYPKMDESQVTKGARVIKHGLWKLNYRRTHQ